MIFINIYYEDDSVKLIQGECLEIMDKLIQQGVKVDAIITDIPYGTTKCKWDNIIPFEDMWNKISVIKKDKSIPVVLFGAEPFSSTLRCSNIKQYKYDWIWQKTRPSLFQHANKRPMKDHEDIMVFYEKQPVYNQKLEVLEKPNKRWRQNKMGTFLEDGCSDKDSLQTKTGYNRQIITYSLHNVGLLHPTQKPLELMEFLIYTYTNEGDLILDFTCGSGTTLIAAKNLHRKCIGIELDEKYCKITKDRILLTA